jgi:hypothetical protein
MYLRTKTAKTLGALMLRDGVLLGRKYTSTGVTMSRKTTLWKLYRLTENDWETINRYQGRVCAITGKPPGRTRLSTDHDHSSGLIRGLLSMRVNRGLAYFDDDPKLLRKAADYLEAPPAVAALGKKVYGLIGRAKAKKRMVYGSEMGPLPVVRKKKAKR